jgi:uncharacterized lipoprotein YmbA
MKYIATTFLFMILVGCGGSGTEYLLSVPASPSRSLHMRHHQIGVDQVTVPDYLSGNKIPKMDTPGEISYCDSAVWVSPPEKALTQHLIGHLKKRFLTPSVYRYPWDVEKGGGVRLKVEINKFIYANSAVELEANYYVEPMAGSRRVSKFFKTSVPVRKGETALIVVGMNRAFDKLAAQVARTIGSF